MAIRVTGDKIELLGETAEAAAPLRSAHHMAGYAVACLAFGYQFIDLVIHLPPKAQLRVRQH
jgi:hypothetical protein